MDTWRNIDGMERIEVREVIVAEVIGERMRADGQEHRPLPEDKLNGHLLKRESAPTAEWLVEMCWQYAQNEVHPVRECRSAMVRDVVTLELLLTDGRTARLAARVAGIGFEHFRLAVMA